MRSRPIWPIPRNPNAEQSQPFVTIGWLITDLASYIKGGGWSENPTASLFSLRSSSDRSSKPPLSLGRGPAACLRSAHWGLGTRAAQATAWLPWCATRRPPLELAARFAAQGRLPRDGLVAPPPPQTHVSRTSGPRSACAARQRALRPPASRTQVWAPRAAAERRARLRGAGGRLSTGAFLDLRASS